MNAGQARRFCLAGLEVSLVDGRRPLDAGNRDEYGQPSPVDQSQRDAASALAGLSDRYALYPSAGAPPELELRVERVPGFGRDRPRGPEYPGFRSRRAGPETIALERFDAVGELTIPADDDRQRPVRGWFRVGDSPNSLEAAVRIGVSVALPRRGGLIMHASAVASAGRAAVFAGKSGAGKSTIAAMLKAHLPTLEAISDELLVLAPTGAPDAAAGPCWEAHVTPFLGSAGLEPGLRRPLGDIHFLVQAPHHRRAPLEPGPALRELLRHVLVYVAEPATAARVLSAAAQLVAAVPCYRLEFAKNPAVARVLGIT